MVVAVQQQMDLNGRAVLLTGGLGGIGLPIVEKLTSSGAQVVVNDLPKQDQVDLPEGIAGYIAGNAAEVGLADHIIDSASDLLGHLPDVVCCHAGIVISSPLLDYTLEQFEQVWRVNTFAQFALAQAAARAWINAEQQGHLIFTGSWVQDVPWPGIAAYCSSKAATKALARSFARELAPNGIRANVIAPGIVGVGMALKQWNTEPDYRARAQKAIPLGSLQTPQSVADAMAFLVSDAAAYMTGQVLTVDGGASLYPMDETSH